MNWINSLVIVILLLSGCTDITSTRIVPGLALATVIEKGITIDGKHFFKLSSTDDDFVDARAPGNPFATMVVLSTWATEDLYNEVIIDDKVVLAYQNKRNELGVVLQTVWIVRKKVTQ